METSVDNAILVAKQLNRRAVVVPPAHIDMAGSIHAGYLLSQIWYWSSKKGFGEFYKTDEEFCNELRFSLKALKGAKNKLKESGLVSIIRKGIPAKSYYKLDLDKYINVLTSLANSEYIVSTKGNNTLVQKGTTITDTTTYIKDNIKDNIKEKNNISLKEPIKTKKVKLFLLEKKLFTLIEEETPNYVSKEVFREFIKHRIAKKKPLSEYAFKLFIESLKNLHVSGEDVNECINQAILNGWDGIFPSKNKSLGKKDREPYKNTGFNDEYYGKAKGTDRWNNFEDHNYDETL